MYFHYFPRTGSIKSSMQYFDYLSCQMAITDFVFIHLIIILAFFVPCSGSKMFPRTSYCCCYQSRPLKAIEYFAIFWLFVVFGGFQSSFSSIYWERSVTNLTRLILHRDLTERVNMVHDRLLYLQSRCEVFWSAFHLNSHWGPVRPHYAQYVSRLNLNLRKEKIPDFEKLTRKKYSENT